MDDKTRGGGAPRRGGEGTSFLLRQECQQPRCPRRNALPPTPLSARTMPDTLSFIPLSYAGTTGPRVPPTVSPPHHRRQGQRQNPQRTLQKCTQFLNFYSQHSIKQNITLLIKPYHYLTPKFHHSNIKIIKDFLVTNMSKINISKTYPAKTSASHITLPFHQPYTQFFLPYNVQLITKFERPSWWRIKFMM